MARKVECIRQEKYAPGTFGMVSVTGSHQAIGTLSIDALRLYLYLCAHCSNGGVWQLSPSAVESQTGLGESTAKNMTSRGYDQLVKAGFIVLDEGSTTSGKFYPDGKFQFET